MGNELQRLILLFEFFFRFPVSERPCLKFEGERLFSTSSYGLTAKELAPIDPKRQPARVRTAARFERGDVVEHCSMLGEPLLLLVRVEGGYALTCI